MDVKGHFNFANKIIINVLASIGLKDKEKNALRQALR
jgi:hypothetical protein